MKLSEAIANYKTYFFAQRYGELSWLSYRRELDRLALWLKKKGMEDLGQVSTRTLLDYGEYARTRGTEGTARPGQVKEATYLQSLRVLRALYSYLNKVEHMENIAETAFPDIRLKGIREADYLTIEQIDEVQDKVSSVLELAIVHTLLATGIRQGELRSCKLRDFLPAKKQLSVIGKGGAQRIVPLTEKCVEYIQHYLKSRRSSTDYLFVKETGEPLNKQKILYMFQRLSLRCGFRVTAHMIRHTVGTRLAEAGVSPVYIKELMGHKSIQTTARYIHRTAEMARQHEKVIERYEK